MGKKKDNCAKELKQIAARTEEQAPVYWTPKEVCQNCVLHRWITPDLFDEQSGEILPQAVVDDRLSVIAECTSCKFGKIDLSAAADQATREQGLTIIGSIRLPASYFIERWQIKHDPFKYTVRGEQKDAYPNHVQVICEKGFEVYEELRPLQWYVGPGGKFAGLEMDTDKKEKPHSLRFTNGLIIILIALILVLVIRKLWK